MSGGASNPPGVIDAVSGPVSDPVEQSRDGSLASRAGQHCADLSIALPLIRVSPTRSASPTPALGDDSNPDPMDEDRVAVLVDSFQSRHGKPLTLKYTIWRGKVKYQVPVYGIIGPCGEYSPHLPPIYSFDFLDSHLKTWYNIVRSRKDQSCLGNAYARKRRKPPSSMASDGPIAIRPRCVAGPISVVNSCGSMTFGSGTVYASG